MVIEITNTPSGNNGDSKIKYCINVILKEAKEEDRAVRQVFYSALSAYTNNPLNVYLAGPSGTGKNYIIEKTLENFPKEDVVFLAGLTDKAVFHRPGKLVIKNSNGEYDDLEILIKKLDHRIEDLHSEMNQTKNSTMKNGLQAQINSVNEEIQTMKDNAMKLIDLSHKILVYLDTPRASLLSALMPLLSQDKYDVEYEFADTSIAVSITLSISGNYPHLMP